MNSITRWLGPACGLVAVIAVIVSEAIAGSIDTEPSEPTAIALAELTESADDIRLGALFGVLAAGLLLVYIGHLRARLGDAGAAWAGNVFAAGGVALVGAVLIFVGVELAGGVAGEHGHAEVAQLVIDFNWDGVWIFSPGLLAIGVGVAVASFSFRALPTWVGVFGVLVGLSAVMPWVGVPIFGLWVVAASLYELISMRQASSTP